MSSLESCSGLYGISNLIFLILNFMNIKLYVLIPYGKSFIYFSMFMGGSRNCPINWVISVYVNANVW